MEAENTQQKVQSTTPEVNPKSKLPWILGIIVLLLLVGCGAYYLGTKNAENTNTSLSSIIPSPTKITQQVMTPTTTINQSDHLQSYSDPDLQGFSFKYDPNSWFIESTENAEACNDVSCSAPYGRTVTVTNKSYKDYPQKLALIITLTEADQLKNVVSPQPICFNDGDLIKLDNNWYRASNPYYSEAQNDQEKIWDRHYYLSSTLKDNGGKKCILGGLNMAQQDTLPVKYKGKPTIMDVELRDAVSSSMESAADDIVKSIKFQ